MNFSTADKVSEVVRILRDADVQTGRAQNRALIVSLFNGDAPYTAQEEEENNIQINVNWKEGTMLLLQAREQFDNAFLTMGNYFSVRLPDAPASKAQKYAAIITAEANKVLKQSPAFLHTMRSKFGSVCLHGRGPQMWEDQYNPIPFFLGVEDLMIPTDTEITLENLSYFAVRRKMRPGQLFRKTLAKGKNIDPGWNVKAVQNILNQYKDLQQNLNNWNWIDHPEKLTELWKQNVNFYDSDAAPVIWFWDFYHQEDDSPSTSWKREIILDSDCVPGRLGDAGQPITFVYHSEKPYAQSLEQILQVQFGDGNNKPPFLYHSTRGLGMLLYDVCQMQNRLRCQFLQKVFEDLMLLFKVKDPSDRSRIDKIYMGLNYGILPDGLEFVKNDERYKLDANLVEMAMENHKQLMGEASASYKQDVDSSPSKEMTAREFSGRMAMVNKLTASMLNLAYLQETYSFQEICRRLAMEKNPDFRCKKFQNACLEQGVPRRWMDTSRWTIEPERVLGSGNTQLEQFQAQSLMSIRPILNPTAQQIVTHEYVFAMTHDPKRADLLAPMDGAPHVTDSIHDSELVFGALMAGNPVTPKPGLNPIEVIETILKLMGGVIQQIQASGGVGNPQQIRGLSMAAQYSGAFIQQLDQDKTAKARVKKYGDALGKIMNMVKAFAQRQQEMAQRASQQGNGADPAAMMKLRMQQMSDQQRLQSKERADQQKLIHNERAFTQKQHLNAAESMANIQRQAMEAAAGARINSREDDES